MNSKLLWLWKLAITRFMLYSLVTMIATYKTATDSVGWLQMNPEQHFDVVLDILTAWFTVSIAFLDKAEKSIETTGLPPDMTTHEETTVTRKTITDTPPDAPPTASTELLTTKTITAATQPPPPAA
jgi:hypothetical protein